MKIRIPTELKDIKLSEYQRFYKITEGIEDSTYVGKKMVEVFCGLSNKQVNAIPKRDFNEIVETISGVLNTKGEFIPTIKYEGLEYGFIPKLDDITVGESADIDSHINDVQKLQKVMGVLYRPITIKNKYGYQIQEYEPADLDLPMNIVSGAMVFFCSLMRDLLNYIPSFIKEELEKENGSTLEESGDGIKTSINLLEETFSSLSKLLNLDYTKQ